VTATLEQVWTEEVYRIHEVEMTHKPTVSQGMDFYAPTSRPIIERAVQRAVEHGDPFDVELEFITAKGNLRWVHAVGEADREHGRVFGTFQDITERKQAEEGLRESEERFRTIFDSAGDGMFLLDLDARKFRMCNAACSRMLGFTPEEFQHLDLPDLHPPQDLSFIFEQIGKVAKGEEAARSTIRFRRKDGTVFFADLTPALLTLSRRRFVLVVFKDVTERRQMEEALRRSEVMAAMGSLLAGVAHEARNPLFGISASLDAFEARFGRQTESARYLAVLRAEANRLNDLMRDLLEYGKPTDPVLVPGSLETVIGEAASACAPLAEESAVAIHVDAGRLPPVPMDRDRLSRALENLLRNAIQHSPRGGVVTVVAHAVRADGRTCIECAVKDRGPGFRTEDLPRVFEPFFSHRKGGTGLGLPIVQRIVEAHGGTGVASNGVDGGAVVTVRLPAG
jgi:PAS domain S-box-containing protein